MSAHLLLPAFAIAALLAGCATSIPVGDKPKTAPARSEKATVYVMDDFAGIPLGAGEIVVVNSKPVAVLSRQQYTWFYMPPGNMDISMNDPGMKGRKMTAQRWQVAPGETYFVRYRPHFRNPDAELWNLFSSESRNAIVLHPEDLTMIPKAEGFEAIRNRKLVGSESF